MNSTSAKTQHYFFLFLLISAFAIMFYVWRPFLGPIVIAGSFAIVFHPVYERIAHRLGGYKNMSALFTVLIILVLVLLPLVFVGGLLLNEARNLYVSLVAQNSSGVSLINDIVNSLQTKLQTISPNITLNVAQYAEAGLQWILTHLNAFFSGFLNAVLKTVVMFIALFFLLRDGRALKDRLFLLSPLDHKYDQNIFSKITLAINSVVKGSLVIALVQGAFATLGFFVTGLPNPIIWGVCTTISSFIPGVGTSLVTVPAIVFLLATQPLWQGVVLAAWAVGGIGLIDNFLTPIILQRGIRIHQFFILISVLGGILYFGPIGFILGPIMLAFFFALLDIYPMIVKDEHKSVIS